MSEIDRLKTIVEKLRSEDGCPWDKVQTHESLKASCIEEYSALKECIECTKAENNE